MAHSMSQFKMVLPVLFLTYQSLLKYGAETKDKKLDMAHLIGPIRAAQEEEISPNNTKPVILFLSLPQYGPSLDARFVRNFEGL